MKMYYGFFALGGVAVAALAVWATALVVSSHNNEELEDERERVRAESEAAITNARLESEKNKEKLNQSREWEKTLENVTNETAAELESARALAEREAEARRLAELKAEKERQERETRIAEMRERLEHEAEARRRAQALLEELSEKNRELAEAQANVEAKLLALVNARENLAATEQETGPLLPGQPETVTVADPPDDQTQQDIAALQDELLARRKALENLEAEKRAAAERFAEAARREEAAVTQLTEEAEAVSEEDPEAAGGLFRFLNNALSNTPDRPLREIGPRGKQ